MSYKIAIDGPSSAGKSTIAKKLAQELGYIYIDTGALYRAVALFLIRNNIDYENEEEIKKVIDNININIEYIDDKMQIILNGENVNDFIRTEKVSSVASKSSVFKTVRDKLLFMQQKLADENNCVMDGRDIASRILPNANLKIFLTASSECRAKRRYEEYKEKGIETTYEKTLEEINERDYRDTHRENFPLKQVEDAKLIDSSNMDIDEVLDKILSFV